MAQRPDDSVYEASLRELLTTNPSSQRELAHLAQYVDAGTPLYGGTIGAGRMQAYYNGRSIPNDLGTLLAAVPGNALADYQSRTRASKAAEVARLDKAWADHYTAYAGSVAVPPRPADWRPVGEFSMGDIRLAGNDGLVDWDRFQSFYDNDAAYQGDVLAQTIDPNAQYVTFRDAKHWGAWDDDPAQYATQYAKYGAAPGTMDRVPIGLLRDKDGQLVKLDGDVSRFVGMETIRPGELDNAVNGLKEQLGGAFDANWNRNYAPKLANLPDEKRGEIYQKTRDQFWNTLDWSDYIKYDPLVGMYANMGAVKHVNDQKFDLLNDRIAPIAQAVMTAVVAAPMAASAGAAAGSAAGGTAASAGASTAAANTIGTVAAGAAKGLVGSAIGSLTTGAKPTGKTLLTSALMGGLSPAAQSLLAGTIGKIGTTATLEAIRQALVNKGKIDPRMLVANTAGQTAAGYVGDKLSDNGLVGRFLGGVSGNAVNQVVRGNGVNGEGLLYAGLGNTGTAGRLLGRAAQTYQRQMALRQQMSRRRPGG